MNLLAMLLVIPVQVNVDAAKESGPLKPIWAYFGYDEPNYTYMKDGRKLLSQIAAAMPGPVYVRAHNLLTTGKGEHGLKWGSTNVYTEDAGGKAVYDWTIVDRIFDTYVERKMKPLVEIGFMPEALSTKPQPYRHSFSLVPLNQSIEGGWAYPPKDYDKWAALVEAWVAHCAARYGKAEAESWLWELWNEPNIMYWRGTRAEFFKLYDVTAAAVKRALPAAKMGGPHTAGDGGDWMRAFLSHVRESKAPLDFLAYHAKGSPDLNGTNVRMGIGNQLRVMERAYKIFNEFPEHKGKPIIIGESDPEGCAACSSRVFPRNAYRNGTLYSSYTAASFARKQEIADRAGANLQGAVTWAFEFEDQPWFDGFRDLATNGVEKPVLNVFRMFGKMGARRVEAVSDHQTGLDEIIRAGVRGAPDIGVLAARKERELAVMLWHYHDEDTAGEAAEVSVKIANLPKGARLTHYSIDSKRSNSYAAWKGMGSPQKPDAAQIKALEKAALLAPGPPLSKDGKLTLERQAVSLLIYRW